MEELFRQIEDAQNAYLDSGNKDYEGKVREAATAYLALLQEAIK